MFIKIKSKIHIFYTYQLKFINQCISLNINLKKKKIYCTSQNPNTCRYRLVQPKQASTTRYFFKNILKEYQYWFNGQYDWNRYNINFIGPITTLQLDSTTNLDPIWGFLSFPNVLHCSQQSKNQKIIHRLSRKGKRMYL